MPKLSYEELIDPSRKYGSVVPGAILLPHEIPVDPDIFNNPKAFQDDFIRYVRARTPDSVADDVKTIERLLNINLDVTVSGKAISSGGDTIMMFTDVNCYAGKEGRSVDLVNFSSNIALDKGLPRWLEPSQSHPVKNIKQFALPDGKIPTWYVHNHLDQGLPLALYFRNFAIMFNNLGIERFKGI